MRLSSWAARKAASSRRTLATASTDTSRSCFISSMVILSMYSPQETCTVGLEGGAKLRTELVSTSQPSRQRSQFFFHIRKDRLPIVSLRLPEEAHGRIPRTVFAVEHPQPMRYAFQCNPHPMSERACKVRNRSVRGDDEIEIAHHRCRVDEGVWSIVKIFAKSLNGHFLRNRRELIQAVMPLQADQPNARELRSGKSILPRGSIVLDRSCLVDRLARQCRL